MAAHGGTGVGQQTSPGGHELRRVVFAVCVFDGKFKVLLSMNESCRVGLFRFQALSKPHFLKTHAPRTSTNCFLLCGRGGAGRPTAPGGETVHQPQKFGTRMFCSVGTFDAPKVSYVAGMLSWSGAAHEEQTPHDTFLVPKRRGALVSICRPLCRPA